jgi:hypothetical protein
MIATVEVGDGASIMTPQSNEPTAKVEYDSFDTAVVEFNDTDYHWEPLTPEQAQEMLRLINRRNPNAPPESNNSKS